MVEKREGRERLDSQLSRQPADVGAERAVLGCLLLDQKAINLALEKLNSRDFYFPKHQLVFQAMERLAAAHEPIDFQTLETELKRQKVYEEIGGSDFLLGLNDEPYFIANLPSYIAIVQEYSALRALMSFGDDIRKRAMEGGEKADAIMESAEDQLFRISESQLDSGLVPIQETLPPTLQHINQMSVNGGKLTGLSTGFRELDRALSGLQKSDLIIIAGRPSMGKTALGVNIAFNAARLQDAEGHYPNHVAIFSLEMSKLQLNQRLVSMASNVDLQKVISGDLNTDADWEQLKQGFDILNPLPIFIDDTSSIPLEQLRAKCRRMKMEHGLDLVLIDYLQLMTVENMRSSENRQQEISTISRGLKGLAKELNCPVIALSQLSRKTESREGARPVMSDMRESGAIEQDADVVILLYREDYYEEETENQNVTDLIVAKHRNGPTGTVQLYFRKELTKFGDLAYVDDPNSSNA